VPAVPLRPAGIPHALRQTCDDLLAPGYFWVGRDGTLRDPNPPGQSSSPQPLDARIPSSSFAPHVGIMRIPRARTVAWRGVA
jgi:hypothetical protein